MSDDAADRDSHLRRGALRTGAACDPAGRWRGRRRVVERRGLTPDPFARPLSSRTATSISLPAAPLGAPQTITPAGASFGPPAMASAGDESFVASAETHGRVLLATRAAGSAAFAAPRTLTTGGDGDVLLAAAGAYVVAAYQHGARSLARSGSRRPLATSGRARLDDRHCARPDV